jgi:hypothetical protein
MALITGIPLTGIAVTMIAAITLSVAVTISVSWISHSGCSCEG